MRKKLKNVPVIGPLLNKKKKGDLYSFRRIEPANGAQSVQNLLNYTKTSESTYNGERYPAGYHSLDLKGLQLAGQRKPKDRLQQAPFDFTGKTVLDIGCNQGGMLFGVADKIAHGVGIDYDSRVVNAANRIRSYSDVKNLDFYVFNLEREDLNLIRDFLPEGKVDIVFLLAVCMWIRNWKEVIRFAASVSGCMLFESNGKPEQQDEQVEFLKTVYKNVQLLSGQSADDAGQKNRRLYFCA